MVIIEFAVSKDDGKVFQCQSCMRQPTMAADQAKYRSSVSDSNRCERFKLNHPEFFAVILPLTDVRKNSGCCRED